MKPQIKAIIFDFGGVLIGWNPRNLFSRYFPGQPQAVENFLNEINFTEWNAHQDRGRPFSEGVALLSQQFPQYAHVISAYYEHYKESITGSIQGTVKLLRSLKAKGYSVYGLSNWSVETFSKVRPDYEFFDLFEKIILSGEVKLLKPEPEIYELCLQRIGRQAGECLFIDDSEPNIITAKKLGFDAVHFKSPEQLESELRIRHLL